MVKSLNIVLAAMVDAPCRVNHSAPTAICLRLSPRQSSISSAQCVNAVHFACHTILPSRHGEKSHRIAHRPPSLIYAAAGSWRGLPRKTSYILPFNVLELA
jgi:hypothetical protein